MDYCETLCCSGNVFNQEKLCATCRVGKLNVVLDLDETLIHAAYNNVKFEDAEAFINFENLSIYKRLFRQSLWSIQCLHMDSCS